MPGDALSVGRDMFSGMFKPIKAKVAETGAKYEVVGRKGTVVRIGSSLRSEQIATLPLGTRVRVVSLSEAYPRRVEIVAVSVTNSASIAGAAAFTRPKSNLAEVADADEGYVADGDGESLASEILKAPAAVFGLIR